MTQDSVGSHPAASTSGPAPSRPPRVPSDAGYPVPSSAAASAVMRGNRRFDTGPEMAVRRLLHARGFRYRVDPTLSVGGVRTRPDIVFPRLRIAVYIDGCFWHACHEHGTRPRANAAYWGPKLQGNVERARRATRALEEAGGAVIRAWEHEDSAAVIARVEQVIAARRSASLSRSRVANPRAR